MENVLLSIGSVCLLKGSNSKVMITGYYSPDFRNGVKINDYMGCYYPYGINNGVVVSFNSSDIAEVLHQGYVDAKFMDLADDFSAYKSSKMVQTSNVVPAAVNAVANPFMNEEPNNARVNVPNDSKQWSIFNHLEFDENGVITSAVLNEDIKNDAEKMEEPTVIKHTANEQGLQFDENGVIISFGGVVPLSAEKEQQAATQAPEEPSPFVFDENGVLIENHMPSKTVSTPVEVPAAEAPATESDGPVYRFDENGMVIAVGNEEISQPVPVAAPVETPAPAAPVADSKGPKYKFDENGRVIEVNE